MELIKINCCSARDLELIPGVGTKIAEKILAIRDSYGNITPEKFSTLRIRDLPLAMSRVDFQTLMAGILGLRPGDAIIGPQ